MALADYNTGTQAGTFQAQSARAEQIVFDIQREFAEMSLWRNTTALQWEEIAELIDPPSRNTFMYGSYNWPGTKKTDRQIDATGMMALGRFAAICDSLLTPRNQTWHALAADDDYVMKDRATRLWFEQATHILFKQRYSPNANFAAQNQMIFGNLGAYGTAGMFIDEFDNQQVPGVGPRYKAIPIGELYIRENHQGLIDGFIRAFRLNARQIYQRWPDTFPETLRPALESHSEMLHMVLHRVCPRSDYDPDRLDARGKRWCSEYISQTGKILLSEGGYRTFPLAASRYIQTPGELYGRSPAMQVLPALKTLNAEKRTFLKAGHRAADPILLTADDGIVDFAMRPGALNKGGISPDGHVMVGTVPVGNIQISKEMMEEERNLINDSFLVSLFQILTETPQMTATEVIERTNEKGILLAPTLGRQQSEYLGPMIDRELDIAMYQGVLPQMPPRLKEAQGAYRVVYTSPLSRAMAAGEASGFMRTLSSVQEIVQITGDPSPLDVFDFDTATPAIARIQAVPESWMATPEAIAAKRKNRSQSQAIQQKIQALPAQAAMMKAQAVVQKNQPGIAGTPGQPMQPQGQPGPGGQ